MNKGGAVLQLKSYATLSDDEQLKVRQFFEAYKGPVISKNDRDVHDYMTLLDLNSGNLFFSMWDKDEVIATLGVVLVAIPTREEVYLTGAALKPSQASIEGMKYLVDYCVGLAEPLPLKIKMGVGPKLAWLMPYVESWGFSLKERMHHLSYAGVAQVCFSNHNLLKMIPLCHDHKLKYIEIHNRSFANVPNGGLITEDAVNEMLTNANTNTASTKTWQGLLFSPEAQTYVGFYELKMKGENLETGWIESIGVDDAFQGRGFGKKALLTCIYFLKNAGANQVELLVMDSNTRAESLYRSQGFELKQVFNNWFEKRINI